LTGLHLALLEKPCPLPVHLGLNRLEMLGLEVPEPAPECLFFLEQEGKVGYRYGQDGAEREAMDYEAFDRIIDHLKLRSIAEKPPTSCVIEQVVFNGVRSAF
jgi:hypothetical protein